MKRVLTIIALLVASSTAILAQTADEILNKMEEAMGDNPDEKGFYMIMDIKIPILGTLSSKTWTLGDKMRIESTAVGAKLITWSDGVTDWVYNSKDNTLEISAASKKSESDGGDLEMLGEAAEGYDNSIEKETDTAWYITCKKSKTNTDKDAPKTMSIVVSKANYYPLRLSAKVKGVTVTMRDLSFGHVSEKQVTFNQSECPNAQVIDKR